MATTAELCIPNIGPRQRRLRLISGLVMVAIATAAAAALLAAGAARAWRLLLIVPVGGAAVGLFQVQAKTCVALAARGLRNLDGGDEAITDAHQLARVKAQSRGVYVKALVTTAVVTSILLML